MLIFRKNKGPFQQNTDLKLNQTPILGTKKGFFKFSVLTPICPKKIKFHEYHLSAFQDEGRYERYRDRPSRGYTLFRDRGCTGEIAFPHRIPKVGAARREAVGPIRRKTTLQTCSWYSLVSAAVPNLPDLKRRLGTYAIQWGSDDKGAIPTSQPLSRFHSVHACGHACMHVRHVYIHDLKQRACMGIKNIPFRLGRLGRGSKKGFNTGFGLPNLCFLRLGRLGTKLKPSHSGVYGGWRLGTKHCKIKNYCGKGPGEGVTAFLGQKR